MEVKLKLATVLAIEEILNWSQVVLFNTPTQ